MTTKNPPHLSEIKGDSAIFHQQYRLKQQEIMRPKPYSPQSDNMIHRLIWGDSIVVIQALLDSGFQQAFDFIYIDPPFNTGHIFHRRNHFLLPNGKRTTIDQVAYSDTWGDHNDGFLHMLYQRVKLMKQLLKKGGILALHCDYNSSAHLKLMLDALFGEANYVNTVIWRRTNSPKAQSTQLGTQYDTIHVYSTNLESITINPVYRNYDKKSLRPYSYEDERGVFRLIELEAKGRQRHAGRKEFQFQGRTAPWLYKLETLETWWNDGLIYKTKNNRYCKKQYLHDMPGTLVSDLWVDDEVAPLQGLSKENTRYPTQKPEGLLSRLITMFSSPGDLIGDFFVGSGTTPVVATKLNRNWVCSDISRLSINVTTSRFLSRKNNSVVIESPIPEKNKNWNEFHHYLQNVVLDHLNCDYTQFPEVGVNGDTLVIMGSPFEEIQVDPLLAIFKMFTASSNKTFRKIQVIGWQYSPSFTGDLELHEKSKNIPQVESWVAPDSLLVQCDVDFLKRNSIKLLPRPEIKLSITPRKGHLPYQINLQQYSFHHPPVNGKNQEILQKQLVTSFPLFIESISLDPNFQKTPYSWQFNAHANPKNNKNGRSLFPFFFDSQPKATVIVKLRDFFGIETLTALLLEE